MGCSRRYDDLPAYFPIPFRDYDNTSVGRFKTSFLAEQIDEYYRGTNPGPIGVATLVNLDDLYNTSSFGRMYSEQLMSELAMKGYDVVEMRHSEALQFMRDGGEFALSRDTGAIRRSRELGGVIVGTYVVSPIRVYVNARLIDPSTSMVLSAGSVEMEKTKELGKLLRVGGFPASLERIPVRHLSSGAEPLYGPSRHGWRYDWEESVGPYSKPGHDQRAPVEPIFKERPHVHPKPKAELKNVEPVEAGSDVVESGS
jgi:TolB-like protein